VRLNPLDAYGLVTEIIDIQLALEPLVRSPPSAPNLLDLREGQVYR
jgi:hypothetical protein